MLAWIIEFIYLAVALCTVRRFAVADLDRRVETAERERAASQRLLPSTWRQYHPEGVIVPTMTGRHRAAWVGVLTALVWPIYLPLDLLARSLRATSEVERARAEELAALRKLAEDNGLKWPGGAS
jgi:hypothetical protein